MNGQANNPPIRSFMRRIPRPNLAGWGIIGREIMAANSALIGVGVFVIGFPWLFRLIATFIEERPFTPPEIEVQLVLWLTGVMMLSGILGLLCGAEEQENESEFFLRTLPVGSLSMYVQKVIGAVLALVGWAVVSLLLIFVIDLLFGNSGDAGFMNELLHPRESSYFIWLALASIFFTLSLSISAWTGRVMLSLFLSAIAAFLPTVMWKNLDLADRSAAWVFAGWISILCLLIAGERFRRLDAGSPIRRIAISRRGLGIGWKDARERGTLWFCMVGALILNLIMSPILADFFDQSNTVDYLTISMIVILTIEAVILGQFFLARDDYDPHTSYLDTLPLERWKIWRIKMGKLLWQYGWLLMIVCAVTMIANVITGGGVIKNWAQDNYDKIGMFDVETTKGSIWAVCLLFLAPLPAPIISITLPALLFSACVSLHIRSRIIGPLITPIIFAPIIGRSLIIFLNSISSGGSFIFQAISDLFWEGMIFSAILAAWHGYAYARTPIRELAGWQRFLLLILFWAVCHEVYTLFIMNGRNMLFLAFGI